MDIEAGFEESGKGFLQMLTGARETGENSRDGMGGDSHGG